MKSQSQPAKVIIIGAGPAGLTAGFELTKDERFQPLIFEASPELGGISKTVNYKGNRIDIGGHRFFSKSDRVMNWWTEILPIEEVPEGSRGSLRYRGKERELPGQTGPDPEQSDDVMLVRSRLSRIYYRRRFFNYPVKLEVQTVKNLGLFQMFKIGLSYLYARLFPLPERSLEEFYINRFGRELYNTFFRDYTEKVWGVPCNQIAPDWGAQRVKGLSITRTLLHAVKNLFSRPSDLAQKGVETSLIEYFLYPKFGPGQMWERVADRFEKQGGKLATRCPVVRIHAQGSRIVAVTVRKVETGAEERIEGDYFVSSMPISELVGCLEGVSVPAPVLEVARSLPFRDFITVGLLLKGLKVGTGVRDNWIYIQEPDVKVGRLQIFNNWSPYMVSDPNTVWVGLEYFVNEGDDLWSLPDSGMIELGIQELCKIDMIRPEDVLDGTVLRVKKTYPAYFGAYNQFEVVRTYLDQFENLFLVGRNGMHRYNNQDHSMLTAMVAVENMQSGRIDKTNIWSVNVEQDYHEEK